MNKNEIKQANRKAVPKFLLIMLFSLILGGAIGFFSAKYSLNALSDSLKSAGAFFGVYIAPYFMLVMAIIIPIVCVSLLIKAKKILADWDGENEDVYNTADKKLSVIMWITSAALILSFFLITASYSVGFSAFESKRHTLPVLVGIASFFAILIEAVLIQQKCVDAVKIMNPEKTASVYDTKFQKKWMDSCDEAEKIMVGKCAYKAFSATNSVCIILSVLLAIFALVFETGFLPSLAVCLIWLVNQSAYLKEAMKYSKAGNKIS